MAVVVQCKSCGVRARAKDQLAGKRVRCKCGAVLAIPKIEPPDDVAELSVLEGLDGSGAPAESETRCPGCLALMPDGAVLCTACGYNTQTGRRLAVTVDDGNPRTPSPNEITQSKTRSAQAEARTGRAVTIVMKLIVIGLVVGGVGGVGWLIKSGLTFDPKQQAKEAHAKVYPGSTVAETVKTIGKGPAEVVVYDEEKQPGPLGVKLPVERRIPYQQDFMQQVDYKLLQYGFFFVYKYSQRDELHIYFDDQGKVIRAELVDPLALIWQKK